MRSVRGISIFLVAGAINLSLGLPAQSQPSMEDRVTGCSTINTDPDRLACYDRLVGRSAQQASASTPLASGIQRVGDWSVNVTKNPLNDTTTIIAMSVASSGSTQMGGKPSLMVRCLDGVIEVFVNWKTFMGSQGGQEVVTRVGDTPAVTSMWGRSTDNRATFHPNSAAFLRAAERQQRVVVRSEPYNESPVTAVFDTAGLHDVLTSFNPACSWKG
jgi:type VI secretion system protein VasI